MQARHWYRGTPEERFWLKVDKFGGEDACWPWLGNINAKGYGIAEGPDGKNNAANIIAYRFAKGEFPEGWEVDHTCHDPLECSLGPECPHRRCQNPKHLEAVPHKENQHRRRRTVESLVCLTHRRFVPCRKKDGCILSSEPTDIDNVRRYQRGEIE